LSKEGQASSSDETTELPKTPKRKAIFLQGPDTVDQE